MRIHVAARSLTRPCRAYRPAQVQTRCAAEDCHGDAQTTALSCEAGPLCGEVPRLSVPQPSFEGSRNLHAYALIALETADYQLSVVSPGDSKWAAHMAPKKEQSSAPTPATTSPYGTFVNVSVTHATLELVGMRFSLWSQAADSHVAFTR
jgi:hypothetical protein